MTINQGYPVNEPYLQQGRNMECLATEGREVLGRQVADRAKALRLGDKRKGRGLRIFTLALQV